MKQIHEEFGALRSLFAEDTHAKGWGERLLELSRQAHALDEQVWEEQWAAYIRSSSHGVPAPLLTVTSLESLEQVIAFLPGCRFDLELDGKKIGEQGARSLAQSPHLASLSSLTLWRTKIGERGASALARSPHLTSLTSLNLGWNRIADKGASALAQSPYLASLSSLILTENWIGAQGVRALAQSPHLTSLTFLGLWGNRIGAEGARALAPPD